MIHLGIYIELHLDANDQEIVGNTSVIARCEFCQQSKTVNIIERILTGIFNQGRLISH